MCRLRMTGCQRIDLTELLEVVDGELVSHEGEHDVQQRASVSAENSPWSFRSRPCGVLESLTRGYPSDRQQSGT